VTGLDKDAESFTLGLPAALLWPRAPWPSRRVGLAASLDRLEIDGTRAVCVSLGACAREQKVGGCLGMGRLGRVVVLLAALTLPLGAGLVPAGCGGGGGRTEGPASIQEATVLLAKPDLNELTKDERDIVQLGLREALAKAGNAHASSALDEQDIVFGPDGRVVMMRVFGTGGRRSPDVLTPEGNRAESISVYSGPPAPFCDGRQDPQLVMVKEYKFALGQWTVSASAIPPEDVPLQLVFSRIDLSVAQDAGLSDDQGRRLRGFSVPFPQPGDPAATVTVWVDLEEGLIRRLEATVPGSTSASFSITLDYDVPIKIEIPSKPTAPDCIPVESGG